MAGPTYRLRTSAWEVLKSLLSLLLAVKEWMERHWPDVVQSPVPDTTFSSSSGDSNLSPHHTQRRPYAYYKTAGRSSSSSALTQECSAGEEKFFAVCWGGWPGVYLQYADCCKAMQDHKNPVFMKFSTCEDAEWFVQNGHDFVLGTFRDSKVASLHISF